MKRLFAILFTLIMAAMILLTCTCCSETAENAHIFMYNVGDTASGKLMYSGFKEYICSKGGKALNKSPLESTVSSQVKLMEELIEQKVATISFSANGLTGYEDVIKKASDSGIKVITVCSKVQAPENIVHVAPEDSTLLGESLLQSAVLIALKEDYPQDKDTETAVKKAIDKYTGEPIRVGILASDGDITFQKELIAAIKKELKKSVYENKVSAEPIIKYGKNDNTISTARAEEFVKDKSVDVIISTAEKGTSAVAFFLKNKKADIKLTGIGLPSQMQGYMPSGDSDDISEYPCPYVLYWDAVDLGRIAGAAAYGAYSEGFTGEEGSAFKMEAFGTYAKREFAVGKENVIIVKSSNFFHKGNINYWRNKF